MGKESLRNRCRIALRSFLSRPPSPVGRPPRDRRLIFNGILWVVYTGAPWRDVPACYGPWQTIYHYFDLWRKDGTFDRLQEHPRERLDRDGLHEWELWLVDGSSVRAGRAAAGAGKGGGRASRWITRWVAPGAGTGPGFTLYATAAARRSPSS